MEYKSLEQIETNAFLLLICESVISKSYNN